MAVTPARWKRLSPLLDAALDLEPAEREAWLAALAPEHSDLLPDLRELLAGRRSIETDDFLNRLPAFSAVPQVLNLAPDSIVGPYRLLRELGTGGTSSVWLAERLDGSIQRKVALKLPHLGLVDRGIGERIARERDILASLEHPNIARLYDAGVDERGRPYLALEYVDGLPPDEYCRNERLDLRAKLELFIKVLRAVSFAHARLIVHRDLKPSNILVRDDGDVRLLDFGIARLLLPDAGTRVAHTAIHTLVGAAALTPAYAAPEQFTAEPVTVATDVYSLGVILFEMLTGVSPYAPDGRSLGAYEHEVRFVEPPRASRAVVPSEAGALRGDLDAIVAKALEKRPADRYVSTEAFANDIERHLSAQPIAARPRSFTYVARKFVRRNAVSLSLGTLVVLALGAALGVAAWQWRDAEKQRQIAVERLANSLAAEDFTSTVLIEYVQPGQPLSFEQLIARSEQIAHDTGAKDVRTRIFATDFLANWYSANGLYREAEAVLTKTIDSLPPHDALVGAALRCKRASLWPQFGREREALAVLTTELANADADDAIASNCLIARASVAAGAGDADGALGFAREALARYELAGVESVFTRAELLQGIGAAHSLSDNFPAAHAQYAAAIELFQKSGRARSRAAAVAHDSWATIWMNSGNPRRALVEADLAREILRDIAPSAQDSDRRLLRRARIFAQLGRFEDATAEFERARNLAKSRGNALTESTVLIGQAELATQSGRPEAAPPHLDGALDLMRAASLPPDDLMYVRHAVATGMQLAARGEGTRAQAIYSKVIDRFEAEHCCRAVIASLLGLRAEIAVGAGDISAAAADAARAREFAPSATGEAFSRYTGRAWYVTGLVEEARNHWREARDAFAIAAVQYAGAVGDAHPDTLRARDAIARAANNLPTQKHN